MKDYRLYQLMADAVRDGLERVRFLVEQKQPIDVYPNWFAICRTANGLPEFNKTALSKCPVNYKSAFSGPHRKINGDEIQSFIDIYEYVDTHSELKNYFGITKRMVSNATLKSIILNLIINLIDRYIHINKKNPFTFLSDRFDSIYVPLECGLLKKNLSVDLLVPILYLNFDFEWLPLFSLSNKQHIGIMKMDEDIQLSRRLVAERNPSFAAELISPATHAMVLTRWQVKNDSYWEVKKIFLNTYSYPMCFIDAAFEALEMLSKEETGYTQILFQPINWAHEYYAQLPPMEGTCIGNYTKSPPIFEWLGEVPTMNEKSLRDVGTLLSRKLNTIRTICLKRYPAARDPHSDTLPED